MGLPNINITFRTAAAAAVQRSQKGVVGLILKDANTQAAGEHHIRTSADIPDALDADNRGYVERALIGYLNPPREVILYVLAGDAEDLDDGLAFFATLEVDYLCGPVDCTSEEASAIAAWVKARRAEFSTVKAVLPNTAADSEGIINYATASADVGETAYGAPAFCSRIAGLIAGTPMTISCTYAPLPEVPDIERLSRADMDAAIDAGKLILYHDGEKAKVARGVNSLVTTTRDKGAPFQKIKIVEAADMIQHDLRRACEDSYIGKYANSYDNKCLLITAVKGYLTQLEIDGILQPGSSQVGIDMAAQEAYLTSTGVDVSKMSEQEIKEANTADKVFLSAETKILDAIEDIDLKITL